MLGCRSYMDSQQRTKLHSQTWFSLSPVAIVLPEDLQREDSLLAGPVGRADIRSGSQSLRKGRVSKRSPVGTKPSMITQRERLTTERPQVGKSTVVPGWAIPSFNRCKLPRETSKAPKATQPAYGAHRDGVPWLTVVRNIC